MKTCTKCLIGKAEEEFSKRKKRSNPDVLVLEPRCKKCITESQKKYQKQYQRQYYINNLEKITKRKYSYRRTEEYRERTRKNSKNIDVICRNMVNSVIRKLKRNKNGIKSIDLLGYSTIEFKIHMESLFKEGMSWENHGEWHVDHIIPVSKFEDTIDIKTINALNNLQPLWANENLRKYTH